MKLTTEYQPSPDAPGAFAAKFGRTAVTLTPDREPRAIYRDGAHVGDWPAYGWSVIVHDELTARAGDLPAAKALGEWYARNSEANARTGSPRRWRHVMTPDAARASLAALDADSAALMAAFPFTPAERARLAAGPHADILEPPPPEILARDLCRLIGSDWRRRG